VSKPFETKGSDKREEFVTGSKRDSREGKGRYDLLSPIALARLAGVAERGGNRYGDRNWERGQPLCRYLDSALRHIFQVLEGRTDEDHAGQAMWNLMAFIHTQELIEKGLLPAELNDMPPAATWAQLTSQQIVEMLKPGASGPEPNNPRWQDRPAFKDVDADDKPVAHRDQGDEHP